MSRRRRKSDRGFTEISPIRTRRLSVREAASKKLHNEDEDSAEELKEPSKKRKRIQSTGDDEIKNISCIARPVTRSFSLDVEVRPRDVLLSKRILQNKDSPTKGALTVKTIKTFSHYACGHCCFRAFL
ncbi:uncharacterized protein LOC124450813 [Xenia sp. Carnegie-2017]|uniref:uncharacterized protein LOC124450813 n=1 Tax=Xenia sp. Carnegie-2017 TaxID=2897299 RepID=UPI001F03A8F9|nr:uncharacterized protein LOC124450813 [Xenia sp. Carnegie-2017]